MGFAAIFPAVEIHAPDGWRGTLRLGKRPGPQAEAAELKKRAIAAGLRKDNGLWCASVEPFAATRDRTGARVR